MSKNFTVPLRVLCLTIALYVLQYDSENRSANSGICMFFIRATSPVRTVRKGIIFFKPE